MGHNITHEQLLSLIGEIDGIWIESESIGRSGNDVNLQDVVVYLELQGRRVELIRVLRTGEGVISHAITRLGIRQELENDLNMGVVE